MLNAVIRFALEQRMLVVAISLFLICYGGWQTSQMEIDVFPNLNRPRVVVMTEAAGMAPEEVEALITFPLETALNGATGVIAVRSSSGVGISIVTVEFDWGTDIYNDRQIVNERLALVAKRMPPGVQPTLAPISSIMGQIIMVGMWSHENESTLITRVDPAFAADLSAGRIPDELKEIIESKAIVEREGRLSPAAQVKTDPKGGRWLIRDEENNLLFAVSKEKNEEKLRLDRLTTDLDVRTLADWVVRPRLLTIPGVSQIFTMGGGRKQFQVLVNPDALRRFGVTLHQVKQAVENANANATGGYLDEQGPNEWLVRALGRVHSIEDLEKVVVVHRDGRSVTLRQVARLIEGPQVKRGDSSAAVRKEDGTFSGGPAVVLTINKQPGADTRMVSQQVMAALAELELSADIQVQPELYSQKSFIDRAINNVLEALRDGGVLVVVILFIFLMNFRTTFITLTAIPVSLMVTALVFTAFGLSINTMTLGGLAVAIGELVDDAIVDVENIFRRLRENRLEKNPRHPLLVVYQASVEIRNSIVFGTMIVVLVFLPLFALSGMEGRLFAPLGVAYIVSILSSLFVSLTLTPVLSYWLLAGRKIWPWIAGVMCLLVSVMLVWWLTPMVLPNFSLQWLPVVLGVPLAIPLWMLVMRMDHGAVSESEGWLLRKLKGIAGGAIRLSLRHTSIVLTLAALSVGIALIALLTRERDFLPEFNEGTVQLNVTLRPGTSLKKTTEIALVVEQRLMQIKEVRGFARRSGRAELDEHAEGVNKSEFIIDLDPHSIRSREAISQEIREAMAEIPGIVSSTEQPLAHLMNHMLSGVKADVAIKIYGDDLPTLRSTARKIKAVIDGVDGEGRVEGVEDLQVEPQVVIPQLLIKLNRDKLESYGLTPAFVNETIETAMNGLVVSLVLIEEKQQTFDLLVRMDERFRENREVLRQLAIDLPGGGTTPLSSLAEIIEGNGPNTINREKVQKRIVVKCNVSGRGLVDVVEEIQARLSDFKLPPGYFIEYGGKFQAQKSASRLISIFFLLSLLGVFLVLYSMFGSANLSLQVLAALPMAFIGSVAALVITDQKLTIPAMVGFISLGGIASRNGILLLNHYLHLVQHEGETWSVRMIIRAGQERLAPVLMTALTSGIGLVPLALAAGEPGKEILYPVATVIIGGLVSSTLLEFLVRPALFWTFTRRGGESWETESEPDLR